VGGSMSSVIISGNTSGAITLSAPDVSGTNTATLPAATGTVMVSGNMPAFSAYTSAAVSMGSSAWTKITFQTEEFDTNNNYSNPTFTPTVAGYYQISAGVNLVTGTGANESLMAIYKNGSSFKYGADTLSSSYGRTMSALVYANGTTDYFEIYFYQSSGSAINTSTGIAGTFFQAVLVRAA
jgi:hypothetical protein